MRDFLNKRAAVAHGNSDGERFADERRGNNRRESEVAVVVMVDSNSHECMISNVGPGGAFLSPGFGTEVGDFVVLIIPGSHVSATARVQRVEARGVGVEFNQESAGALITAWSRGLVN